MLSTHKCRAAVLAFLSALSVIVLPPLCQTAAAQDNALARFPVAHDHSSGWCLGYLYIYADSIAYDVTWPATEKGHSFRIRVSDIQQVARSISSGQQLKAVELRSGQATFRFWWLANEQDVINGRAYQFNPPDAGDPDPLIAAIRNPSTLNAPDVPAASAQAAPPAGEQRFAVAHAHAASQCVGYLYVSATRVRYEVAQPESDKKHSVDLSRTEISAVQQWFLLGTPLNAVEVKTSRGNYHFWLIQDGIDLRSTAAKNVRFAPGSPLLAALQGRPDAVMVGGSAPPAAAASAPAYNAAPAPGYPAPTATGFPPPSAQATAAGAAMPNVIGPNSLAEYVFTTPPGWTANRYSDGIVLSNPPSNTGERCLISMWPMRAAGADLQTDANAAFQNIFATYEPRNRTSDGSPVSPVMIRGRSGQGWDYLIVKRGIGKPNGPGGPFESLQGFVMVARLNNNLAVISGLSKVPLVSGCFGELLTDVWPRFFYSLRFRDWPVVDQGSTTATRLAGVWTSATGTAADQYQFAANGRFGTAAAVQHYNRISSTEVLATTQAFFGNGSYSLRENTITLTPDPGAGQPETGFLRLEEESRDGRTWVPILYLLRISVVDGKDYEVRYQKN